jgi:hypothetical protein
MPAVLLMVDPILKYRYVWLEIMPRKVADKEICSADAIFLILITLIAFEGNFRENTVA